MARGRPISGVALVDRLAAPRAVRQRLRVVLGTLTGTCTIRDACAQLGIERARLYRLRQQALQGAVDALMPRPRGRPRSASAPDRTRELTARIHELELALRATQLRSEIALTMPFLLDRAAGKKKRTARRRASPADPRSLGGARRTPRGS